MEGPNGSELPEAKGKGGVGQERFQWCILRVEEIVKKGVHYY